MQAQLTRKYTVEKQECTKAEVVFVRPEIIQTENTISSPTAATFGQVNIMLLNRHLRKKQPIEKHTAQFFKYNRKIQSSNTDIIKFRVVNYAHSVFTS